jgi:hypothetical protein
MLQPTPIDLIADCLRAVRLTVAGMDEAEIRTILATQLMRAGFVVRVEYTFAPRCRADLWIDGVVIEIKKQRPATAAVLGQLHKYAEKPNVGGIILVLERSVSVLARLAARDRRSPLGRTVPLLYRL